MIPKIIHYIWVGSDVPEYIQNVIDKNSHFFHEYEVKIWTEENMPHLNAFAQRAYDEQKWAFVSDYLRFKILHQEGGIYLDTDMEVLKPLDDLLEHSFFAGWDRTGKYVYAGIIGAKAADPYIKNILNRYDKVEEGGYSTSPEIMTECYVEYKEKAGLRILESSYFYPLLDGEKATENLMKNAYTNHLWFESWRKYVWLRKIIRRIGLMKVYHYFLFKIKGLK